MGKPRIVNVPFYVFGYEGLTLYPWVFLFKNSYGPEERAIAVVHESSHWEDQRAWYRKAWVFGLLAWWLCYEFALPIGWNPLRRQTETKAYAVSEHLSVEKISAEILPHAPFWLWW